jgi:transcriptional regulator with XRE-family HTH domain
LPINIVSTADLLKVIATKAKSQRLAENLSRRSLAERSGVTEASIKRFETSGEVSLTNLLDIAFALDCTKEFEALFDAKAPASINDLQKPPRQRGSR